VAKSIAPETARGEPDAIASVPPGFVTRAAVEGGMPMPSERVATEPAAEK